MSRKKAVIRKLQKLFSQLDYLWSLSDGREGLFVGSKAWSRLQQKKKLKRLRFKSTEQLKTLVNEVEEDLNLFCNEIAQPHREFPDEAIRIRGEMWRFLTELQIVHLSPHFKLSGLHLYPGASQDAVFEIEYTEEGLAAMKVILIAMAKLHEAISNERPEELQRGFNGYTCYAEEVIRQSLKREGENDDKNESCDQKGYVGQEYFRETDTTPGAFLC